MTGVARLTLSTINAHNRVQHDGGVGRDSVDFLPLKIANGKRHRQAIGLQRREIQCGNLGGLERDFTGPFTSRLQIHTRDTLVLLMKKISENTHNSPPGFDVLQ